MHGRAPHRARTELAPSVFNLKEPSHRARTELAPSVFNLKEPSHRARTERLARILRCFCDVFEGFRPGKAPRHRAAPSRTEPHRAAPSVFNLKEPSRRARTELAPSVFNLKEPSHRARTERLARILRCFCDVFEGSRPGKSSGRQRA